MPLPSLSNYISLSNIQTEFGGTAPILFSEYYSGGVNVPGSVSGIPSSGPIFLSNFAGKSKPVATGLAGLNTWHQTNGSSYTSYITSWYNYTYDGVGNYIGDGGYDMYDNGNYLSIEGTMNAANITYGTVVDNGTSGYMVSGNNYRPFIGIAYISSAGTIKWLSTGDIGSDGGGTVSNYSGTYSCANGRNGTYWMNVNYNAGDPSVGSLWFTIQSTSWGSTHTGTTDSRKTSDGNYYSHFVTITGSKIIFAFALLSRSSGQYIDSTMVTNFLSNYVQNMPISFM